MRVRGTLSSFLRPFCLCALLAVSISAVAEPEKRQTKVICRDEFSGIRREELTRKLRAITGWTDLGFDRGGSLQIGTREPVGGSEGARVLLTRALSGTRVLIIEDASKRKDVVFCKLIPGRWKGTETQGPPVSVVLIDFADFDCLIGDRLALQAFDAGWGFLHELDHAINHSPDSGSLGQAGECEEHINRMRRELALPERSDYFFTYFPHTQDSGFSTRYVRLPFDQKDAASKKSHRYWLVWDAAVVGGLSEALHKKSIGAPQTVGFSARESDVIHTWL